MCLCFSVADTPSQRVQFLLGMEDDEEHIPHALFTELDEICLKEGEDAEWKETARYKYTHMHTEDCHGTGKEMRRGLKCRRKMKNFLK